MKVQRRTRDTVNEEPRQAAVEPALSHDRTREQETGPASLLGPKTARTRVALLPVQATPLLR